MNPSLISLMFQKPRAVRLLETAEKFVLASSKNYSKIRPFLYPFQILKNHFKVVARKIVGIPVFPNKLNSFKNHQFSWFGSDGKSYIYQTKFDILSSLTFHQSGNQVSFTQESNRYRNGFAESDRIEV